MKRQIFGSVLFIGWVAAGHAACNLDLHPDAAPETAQFGFLVGTHDITLHAWTGEGWTPARPVNARWLGYTGLDGRAIYDEWYDPQGGSGVNVRFYDAQESVWKMMWISTTGRQVQDLRARMMDGVLTMWQVYPPREGWQAQFHVLDDTRWAREDFVRNPDGSIKSGFRLVATRESCAAREGGPDS